MELSSASTGSDTQDVYEAFLQEDVDGQDGNDMPAKPDSGVKLRAMVPIDYSAARAGANTEMARLTQAAAAKREAKEDVREVSESWINFWKAALVKMAVNALRQHCEESELRSIEEKLWSNQEEMARRIIAVIGEGS